VSKYTSTEKGLEFAFRDWRRLSFPVGCFQRSERPGHTSIMEKNPAALEIIAESSFHCNLCGKEAGHIQLLGNASNAEVRRSSFTSEMTAAVPTQNLEKVQCAISEHDAAALFALDLEFVPFYCPQCNANYCGDHWDHWLVFDDDMPSWLDSIRGICPQGHERMLED
jgi:hypothetical protein